MEPQTITSALAAADAHITRLNAAQTSPTFPVEFDDPDEVDDDDDEEVSGEPVRNPDNSEEDE